MNKNGSCAGTARPVRAVRFHAGAQIMHRVQKFHADNFAANSPLSGGELGDVSEEPLLLITIPSSVPSTTNRSMLMKLTLPLLLALALMPAAAMFAQETPKPGGPPGGPGGPGEPGRRPAGMNPLIAALDANHDGVIDAKEIDNAPAALRSLDKNKDGQLTMDELRPARPGGPG